MDYWEYDEEPERPHYKTAQICRNGHMRSVDVEYHNDGPRCTECGAENISACPDCGQPIHGRYHQPGVTDLTGHYDLPRHCHNCGTPYPWTEAKVQALHDLVDEMEGLSEQEKQRLGGSLHDLIVDTPQSEVAVTRLKKALAKAGAEVVNAAKSILIEIGTEAVKKSMGIK